MAAAARARPAVLAGLAVSLALAACGGDGATSSALVDLDRPAPISDLALDPAGDDLLLSTNRGLWRIANGEAQRIEAQVRTADGISPIGTFLAFVRVGDELLGSGHPDTRGRLANFLGLIRSTDGGRNWRTVSRYGFADLHTLRFVDERLYALDAVLGAVLSSEDRGRTWTERVVPPGFVLDLAVDPDGGKRLLLSYEDRIVSSEDGGSSWQPVGSAERARLAWAEDGSLYRADRDGRVFESGNGGESWSLVGLLDGEPWKLEPVGAEHLLAALKDATIMESTDGGRSWEEIFAP